MTKSFTPKQSKLIAYCLESFIAGLDDAIPQEGDEELIEEVNEIIRKCNAPPQGIPSF